MCNIMKKNSMDFKLLVRAEGQIAIYGDRASNIYNLL